MVTPNTSTPPAAPGEETAEEIPFAKIFHPDRPFQRHIKDGDPLRKKKRTDDDDAPQGDQEPTQ